MTWTALRPLKLVCATDTFFPTRRSAVWAASGTAKSAKRDRRVTVMIRDWHVSLHSRLITLDHAGTLYNRLATASCQLARRMASCPTTHSGVRTRDGVSIFEQELGSGCYRSVIARITRR